MISISDVEMAAYVTKCLINKMDKCINKITDECCQRIINTTNECCEKFKNTINEINDTKGE